MEIYTIGFTKRSASDFFESLKSRGIECVLDVRISNTSQLAGFTKRDDLVYFLREIVPADYLHEPLLAPTREMFRRYRGGEMTWADLESAFLDLMAERRIEEVVSRELFARPTVLLCSEATPQRCHRRLVVEYLGRAWGDVTAIHL